ncbi:hypothetical protein ACOMHN_047221 [Nucella lapillus]
MQSGERLANKARGSKSFHDSSQDGHQFPSALPAGIRSRPANQPLLGPPRSHTGPRSPCQETPLGFSAGPPSPSTGAYSDSGSPPASSRGTRQEASQYLLTAIPTSTSPRGPASWQPHQGSPSVEVPVHQSVGPLGARMGFPNPLGWSHATAIRHPTSPSSLFGREAGRDPIRDHPHAPEGRHPGISRPWTRLLFPPLRRPQAKRQLAPDPGPIPPEQIHPGHQVQDKFIRDIKFRMESTSSFRESIRSGDWAASIDLKDAYFHITLAQALRKYLRFVWRGRTFQFKALPFGLSLAPFVFTKVCTEVASLARTRATRLRCYLDDWLILAETQELCQMHSTFCICATSAYVWGFSSTRKSATSHPVRPSTFWA